MKPETSSANQRSWNLLKLTWSIFQDQDAADLKVAAVQHTPTFFVNGKPLTSFGVEPLAALVQSEVDQSQ